MRSKGKQNYFQTFSVMHIFSYTHPQTPSHTHSHTHTHKHTLTHCLPSSHSPQTSFYSQSLSYTQTHTVSASFQHTYFQTNTHLHSLTCCTHPFSRITDFFLRTISVIYQDTLSNTLNASFQHTHLLAITHTRTHALPFLLLRDNHLKAGKFWSEKKVLKKIEAWTGWKGSSSIFSVRPHLSSLRRITKEGGKKFSISLLEAQKMVFYSLRELCSHDKLGWGLLDNVQQLSFFFSLLLFFFFLLQCVISQICIRVLQ